MVDLDQAVLNDISELSELLFAGSGLSFAGVKNITVIPDGALSLILSLLTYPDLNATDFADTYSPSLQSVNISPIQVDTNANILAIVIPRW